MFWALFFFFMGITLIVLEFVLPGIVCGVAGTVMLFVSGIMGIQAYPDYTFSIIIGEFFGAAVGIGVGLLLLTKTSSATGLSLETNLTEEGGYVNLPTNTALIGRAGVVMTALRPSGTIVVDGERHDAVSDGDFIDEGEAITVVEVHGNRVVVARGEA